MPKYLDSSGVSYLWSKIKNITKNNLICYSKTTEEWNSDKTLLSQKNILYVYTDYKIIIQDSKEILLPGLKIGDGVTYLIDLPFLNNNNDAETSTQVDWNEIDFASDAFIKNKPTINHIELMGDKSGNDLNLQDKMEILSQTDIEKILYLG